MSKPINYTGPRHVEETRTMSVYEFDGDLDEVIENIKEWKRFSDGAPINISIEWPGYEEVALVLRWYRPETPKEIEKRLKKWRKNLERKQKEKEAREDRRKKEVELELQLAEETAKKYGYKLEKANGN